MASEPAKVVGLTTSVLIDAYFEEHEDANSPSLSVFVSSSIRLIQHTSSAKLYIAEFRRGRSTFRPSNLSQWVRTKRCRRRILGAFLNQRID